MTETQANMVGAFPAQFAKEGFRGFINADFNIGGLIAGGLMESVELCHLFWLGSRQKEEKGSEEAPAQPPASLPEEKAA